MSGTRRVAILGGSSAFLPDLAAALCDAAAELPAELELLLVGRDAARTATVAGFCQRLAVARGVAHHRYVPTIDWEPAVDAADVVVNQIRVGGFAGRSHDETFPLAHGLPGDETLGPGGLAAGIRSLPLFLEVGRRIVARDAARPLLQMSNPLGISLRGLAAVEGLRATGLCELPGRTLARAAARIGLDAETLHGSYLGVNHQGGFLAAYDADGVDRLPDLLSGLDTGPADPWFGVPAAVQRARGFLHLPYLRLYEDPAGVAAARSRRPGDRGRELAALADDLFAYYREADGCELPSGLAARATPWNREAVVPALATVFDERPRPLALSVRNAGWNTDLDDDAVVEVFGRQTVGGTRPAAPGACDGTPAARAWLVELMRAVDRFEAAAVEAALDPCEERVVACLTLHPFGIDPDTARRLCPAVLATVEC